MLVVADDLQAGWKRILQILDDPHAAAVVKAHVQRLCNDGLGCDEVNCKSIGGMKLLERFSRWRRSGVVADGAPALEGADELFHFLGAGEILFEAVATCRELIGKCESIPSDQRSNNEGDPHGGSWE